MKPRGFQGLPKSTREKGKGTLGGRHSLGKSLVAGWEQHEGRIGTHPMQGGVCQCPRKVKHREHCHQMQQWPCLEQGDGPSIQLKQEWPRLIAGIQTPKGPVGCEFWRQQWGPMSGRTGQQEASQAWKAATKNSRKNKAPRPVPYSVA